MSVGKCNGRGGERSFIDNIDKEREGEREVFIDNIEVTEA
jgi:hypothetical protein